MGAYLSRQSAVDVERTRLAEIAFRKAIDVWPDRSVPYWTLAHFLERRGESEEAGRLYLKALDTIRPMLKPTDVSEII
jgi:hypothetical protein